MANLGDIFGKGTIGEQLLVWGALNQVIGSLLQPGLLELSQSALKDFPVVPLSASEVAAAINRSYMGQGAGEDEAGLSGVNASRLKIMSDLAGDAPGISALAEALRRKIITTDGLGPDSTSFQQGIAESNLHNKWANMIAQLTVELPSTAEVLDAWLKGQIDPGEASTRYIEAGGDPTWFQTAYNAAGSAPSPLEAVEMANRGVIPWGGTGPDVTSYEQAFLEGPWRNKWADAYRALAAYVPPARTVTAMLKEGALTEAQALHYLQADGLPADLAAIYVKAASTHASATAKALSESTVVALYEDKLIDQAQALTELVALKYSAADAQLLLELADLKSATAATKSAVTRLQSLYIARKNDAPTTLSALHELGIADAQASGLLAVWDLESAATVRRLTESQVVQAFKYSVFDQPTAQQELVNLGYSTFDAWVLLSIENKAPLGDQPGAGTTGAGINP